MNRPDDDRDEGAEAGGLQSPCQWHGRLAREI